MQHSCTNLLTDNLQLRLQPTMLYLINLNFIARPPQISPEHSHYTSYVDTFSTNNKALLTSRTTSELSYDRILASKLTSSLFTSQRLWTIAGSPNSTQLNDYNLNRNNTDRLSVKQVSGG